VLKRKEQRISKQKDIRSTVHSTAHSTALVNKSESEAAAQRIKLTVAAAQRAHRASISNALKNPAHCANGEHHCAAMAIQASTALKHSKTNSTAWLTAHSSRHQRPHPHCYTLSQPHSTSLTANQNRIAQRMRLSIALLHSPSTAVSARRPAKENSALSKQKKIRLYTAHDSRSTLHS
jgi:hypothetical protein